MSDIPRPPLPADFQGVTGGLSDQTDSGFVGTVSGLQQTDPDSTVPVQQDYFGFADTERVYLPDNVSWVEIRLLNEGARQQYMNVVNQEIRMDRQGRDAFIKTKAGDERLFILKTSIIGWNLQRGGVPIPFGKNALEEFLRVAPPSVVDVIERRVRQANKWLTSEVTLDDIAEQRKELDRIEQEVLDRQAGKVS